MLITVTTKQVLLLDLIINTKTGHSIENAVSYVASMGTKVDFVISCGAACRPAHYAQKLCLRKFSSPCDWMMKYSLKDFIQILSTEGKLMFKNAKYDEANKWVCWNDFNA